jgi:DNA-binding response OmpR family regulator
MNRPSIKLMHIEDDPVWRRIVAHHLSSIKEYQFDVHPAESEDAAIHEFEGGGVEFVILDYTLKGGDGLGCVKKLRRRDGLVPIIAVSGLATPDIAAEMLRFGADDFISKQDLSGELLARSVRGALARALAGLRRTEELE